MKKGLWYIFKCQNCGKMFQEKETGLKDSTEMQDYANRIGIKTHIVSTHKCKPNVWGCAKLIGCQIWSKEGE